MKYLFLLMSALLLSVSMPAVAENGNGPDHFSASDADGDGKVSRAEAEAYYDTLFIALDVTGDSRLDPAECDYGCVMFRPGEVFDQERLERQGDISRIVKSRFSLFDEDGDGMLSREEYLRHFLRDFMARDKNRDNAVDRQEHDARKE